MGNFGLMVMTCQVVLDDQVEPEKDQRFVLVAQYLGCTERMAVIQV